MNRLYYIYIFIGLFWGLSWFNGIVFGQETPLQQEFYNSAGQLRNKTIIYGFKMVEIKYPSENEYLISCPKPSLSSLMNELCKNLKSFSSLYDVGNDSGKFNTKLKTYQERCMKGLEEKITGGKYQKGYDSLKLELQEKLNILVDSLKKDTTVSPVDSSNNWLIVKREAGNKKYLNDRIKIVEKFIKDNPKSTNISNAEKYLQVQYLAQLDVIKRGDGEEKKLGRKIELLKKYDDEKYPKKVREKATEYIEELTPKQQPTPPTPKDTENDLWNKVLTSPTLINAEGYLEEFPDGQFSNIVESIKEVITTTARRFHIPELANIADSLATQPKLLALAKKADSLAFSQVGNSKDLAKIYKEKFNAENRTYHAKYVKKADEILGISGVTIDEETKKEQKENINYYWEKLKGFVIEYKELLLGLVTCIIFLFLLMQKLLLPLYKKQQKRKEEKGDTTESDGHSSQEPEPQKEEPKQDLALASIAPVPKEEKKDLNLKTKSIESLLVLIDDNSDEKEKAKQEILDRINNLKHSQKGEKLQALMDKYGERAFIQGAIEPYLLAKSWLTLYSPDPHPDGYFDKYRMKENKDEMSTFKFRVNTKTKEAVFELLNESRVIYNIVNSDFANVRTACEFLNYERDSEGNLYSKIITDKKGKAILKKNRYEITDNNKTQVRFE